MTAVPVDLANSEHPSKASVLSTASIALATGILNTMSMDPHDAAVAAHIPNVTPPVDELEAQIRRFHAEAEARVKDAA